jgi:4-hydroxyphenylpyruvate dioxygenase
LRAKALDRAEHKFDLMQELGTDLILICSSCPPEALGGIGRAAANFYELGERAAKRGLRVGYEALAWGRYVNDHRNAWEIVRRADHKNVGLILDSVHTLTRKIDPDPIRHIPGDKIFFVHFADAPAIEMNLLYWSRHFRNMPGEGDLDMIRFTRAVMATGYSGPISLEIFNDQFRRGRPKTIAKDGYQSLVALMDDVNRAEPALALDVPDTPERVNARGISFIEFASKAEEADALDTLLYSLGFNHSNDHFSMNLTLWTQGDIRILVNRKIKGYSSSAFAVHGTNVCDIGIAVDDAKAAVKRAKLLGADLFKQQIDPRQMNIPTIHGQSGSILHFIDEKSGLSDVWDVEFTSSGEKNLGTGLTRIDHVGQTMSYEDMLSWSLFYTTLFDMGKSAIVDVVDPDGLIRSQALETPDGRLRVTLNGAEIHKTLAGSFLADSFYASVQHIAFATDDIFSTAKDLDTYGFSPLPSPDNYYADLAARFNISSDTLAQLRMGNILYDEDAQGKFFQLYSRPFAGGMFFEIIQRTDGYGGYGGPNAPFRIAAQKRLMRQKGMPKI